MNVNKTRIAAISAVALGVGTLALVGSRVLNPHRRCSCIRKGYNGVEDKAIYKFLDESENYTVFAKRYANWLLNRKGAQAVADAMYITAVRDWGIFTPEEVLIESQYYFGLNYHSRTIVIKFGDLDSEVEDMGAILDMVLKHLCDAVTKYQCTYHYYDSIEDATAWERSIPQLRGILKDAVYKRDIDRFEGALTSYLLLLQKYDGKQYVIFRDRLEGLFTTEDVDYLDSEDLELYDMLNEHQNRIRKVLGAVENAAFEHIIRDAKDTE